MFIRDVRKQMMEIHSAGRLSGLEKYSLTGQTDTPGKYDIGDSSNDNNNNNNQLNFFQNSERVARAIVPSVCKNSTSLRRNHFVIARM